MVTREVEASVDGRTGSPDETTHSSRTHRRLQVRLREAQRRAIRLCGGLSSRDAEYDFAARQVAGQRQRVLDVGGCESLLPLQLARRGHEVTVYDFRPYPEPHQRVKSIQGDFLENRLPDVSFDCVLFVSTIEHIGFGSYGAPIHPDGDLRAFAEARRVLRPSGRIVVTAPFADREREISGFERWYDLNRVRRLFEGMHVLAEEYYRPELRVLGRVVRWLPASVQEITGTGDVVRRYGSQCVACYAVSPSPRASGL